MRDATFTYELFPNVMTLNTVFLSAVVRNFLTPFSRAASLSMSSPSPTLSPSIGLSTFFFSNFNINPI